MNIQEATEEEVAELKAYGRTLIDQAHTFAINTFPSAQQQQQFVYEIEAMVMQLVDAGLDDLCKAYDSIVAFFKQMAQWLANAIHQGWNELPEQFIADYRKLSAAALPYWDDVLHMAESFWNSEAQIHQKSPNESMDVSEQYIDYLEQYEKFNAHYYRGQGSQNETIGFGHVRQPHEHLGTLTFKQAESLLKNDLQSRIDYVNKQAQKYHLSLNQHQFDGLVDMVFNKGHILNPDRATFFKLIVEHSNKDNEIFHQFSEWDSINGKFSQDTYQRSADAADIFLNGDYTRDYRNFPQN